MKIDEKFKAITDPMRRKILDALRNGSLNAGEIATICDTTKPNISQHLQVLKKNGFIQDEKKGLYVFYELVKNDFQITKREVMNLVSIKEKILSEVKRIVDKKECEFVMGATNSQDEGIVYIMKEAATILSFQYSFRLSSFEIILENPTETFSIPYTEDGQINLFLQRIQEILYLFLQKEQTNSEVKSILQKRIQNDSRYVQYFGKTDSVTLETLRLVFLSELQRLEIKLNPKEEETLIEELTLEVISHGKLHNHMEDDEVSDITIVGTKFLSITKNGKYETLPSPFETTDEVMRYVKKLTTILNRKLEQTCPFLTDKLPDGSKINISLPQVMSDIIISIKKQKNETYTLQDLVQFGSLSQEMAEFLEDAVRNKCNILITGTNKTGKTTLLDALSKFVTTNEKTVLIEQHPEIQLDNSHMIRLETRLPDENHCGQITTRDLLKFCYGLEPHRIILGEMNGTEAYDALEFIYGGMRGFMSTVHAENTRHALSRFANLILYAGFEIEKSVLLERICDAVDIVVEMGHFPDGTKKIVSISQIIDTNKEFGDENIVPLYTYKLENTLDGMMTGTFIRTNHAGSKGGVW